MSRKCIPSVNVSLSELRPYFISILVPRIAHTQNESLRRAILDLRVCFEVA